MDTDLLSIQEARDLAVAARNAQLVWAEASQADVDRVCEAMAEAAYSAAAELGKIAAEETGFGNPAHKKIKNEFAALKVWESIKDEKTVGVVHHDQAKSIYEIAYPMGVIAALIPSTNPTSTIIAKTLAGVKARDAIVHAPHPSAFKCSNRTVEVLAEAAVKAGAPTGLVQCMSHISLEGTQELMRHKYVALILATGGGPMVKAAHSVGKPAYGVGPGNVPVYVDRTADVDKAARYIVNSKAFDQSTICATEQAVIADRPIAPHLAELMQQYGAYFVSEEQADLLRALLFYENGAINPATVGKTPQYLASMCGFQVPDTARILVARLSEVGKQEPLSREKLTTVLAWYEADGWRAGCERAIELIQFGGRGHTQIIYSNDQDVIMAFGLEKPVFRILVNTVGTLGAIGYTTGLMPSLTLGAGGLGGSITGDNITTRHLLNIKRLAFEVTPPPPSFFSSEPTGRTAQKQITPGNNSHQSLEEIEALIEAIAREIIQNKS